MIDEWLGLAIHSYSTWIRAVDTEHNGVRQNDMSKGRVGDLHQLLCISEIARHEEKISGEITTKSPQPYGFLGSIHR